MAIEAPFLFTLFAEEIFAAAEKEKMLIFLPLVLRSQGLFKFYWLQDYQKIALIKSYTVVVAQW